LIPSVTKLPEDPEITRRDFVGGTLVGTGVNLGRTWGIALALLCALDARVFGAPVPPEPAPLPPDSPNLVQSLPDKPSPHWVWVNDIVFTHMASGQALLVDGDSGQFLGLLGSTGFSFERIVLVQGGSLIFSPEIYFSRGTRGVRTDVVTVYDAANLKPLEEIVIPPKRSSNFPMMANAEVTDDDRFLLIYNFTPAQSVTVVDTQARKFVDEIETPGCGLVYPTGPRSFFSICGDGSLLDVRLDDSGHATSRQRTDRVFDLGTDPVTERAVRLGATWLFVSFGGTMYPITITPDGLKLAATWSLLVPTEGAQGWRPGGAQQLAVHAGLNRLYSIMHRGPIETHKDPGKDVWVYDLARHVRIQRIAMKSTAGSIQVTRDTKPLLFAAFNESSTLDVYDAATGNHLRSIDHIGTTPTLLVTP
jgi:methylamine dehydrogenase heavy chain